MPGGAQCELALGRRFETQRCSGGEQSRQDAGDDLRKRKLSRENEVGSGQEDPACTRYGYPSHNLWNANALRKFSALARIDQASRGWRAVRVKLYCYQGRNVLPI